MQIIDSMDKFPFKEKGRTKFDNFFLKDLAVNKNYSCMPVQALSFNGSCQHYTKYLCHYEAFLNLLTPNCNQFFNLFTTQVSKGSKNLTDYLLSEDSPYADLFDNDDIYLLHQDGYNKLLAVSDFKSVPMSLFANFLIATRLASAWALGLPWLWMQEQGFSAREALILSCCFSWNKQILTISSTRDGRHLDDPRKTHCLIWTNTPASDQPFTMSYLQEGRSFSPKKFIDGDYKLDSDQNIKDKGNHSVCNYIWSKKNQNPINTIKSIDTLASIANAFNKMQSLDKDLVDRIKNQLNNDEVIK